MAGDWIKMRTSLQRDPRVVRVASALNADRFRVIGGLHAVWSLADEQTEDGHLNHYTFDALDQLIGWPGFCQALKAVDWIAQREQGVVFPRFEEHNGASAKRRAQEMERKRVARSSAGDADNSQDKTRTREEKRREETLPGFEKFWEIWPRSHRKAGKSDCFKVWLARSYEAETPLILRHVEAMCGTPDWKKDGGSWIPAPKVYLNQRRWDGADLAATTSASGMPAGMI